MVVLQLCPTVILAYQSHFLKFYWPIPHRIVLLEHLFGFRIHQLYFKPGYLAVLSICDIRSFTFSSIDYFQLDNLRNHQQPYYLFNRQSVRY